MKLLFEASALVRAPPVRRLIDDGWILRAPPRHAASVDPSGQTILTYRVFNIVKHGVWAVSLANRMFIEYDRTGSRWADGPGRGGPCLSEETP